MRSAVIYIAAAIVLVAPATIPAQRSTTGSMSDRPDIVLGQYLMRRQEVTKTTPTVVFCGQDAIELVTDEVRSSLLRPRAIRSYVDSVVINPTCPYKAADAAWLPPRDPDREILWVMSMHFGPLSSTIEAFAQPKQSDGPPYPPVRRERFTWDHTRAMGGQQLIFTDFRPPH
jgi:hypothetical protein